MSGSQYGLEFKGYNSRLLSWFLDLEVEGRVPHGFISPYASHYSCPKGVNVEELKSAALVE